MGSAILMRRSSPQRSPSCRNDVPFAAETRAFPALGTTIARRRPEMPPKGQQEEE